MSTSSWQVQCTLAAPRWGHSSQWLLSVKTRAEAIGARLPKMIQWLQNPLMKQETCSGVLPKLEGLDPPLSYIRTAQPPSTRCFGLSPGETADLASSPCLHIYSFENTIAKSIQAEQEEMQNSRTAVGLAWLPALGPLCWGRLPHPSLAHSSPKCPLHMADISATEL